MALGNLAVTNICITLFAKINKLIFAKINQALGNDDLMTADCCISPFPILLACNSMVRRFYVHLL